MKKFSTFQAVVKYLCCTFYLPTEVFFLSFILFYLFFFFHIFLHHCHYEWSADKFYPLLTLSMPSKIFSRRQIEIFFLFSRKLVLTFHANCLKWRQTAWNVESCFSGENNKNINLLSAESAQRVVKVKVCQQIVYTERIFTIVTLA